MNRQFAIGLAISIAGISAWSLGLSKALPVAGHTAEWSAYSGDSAYDGARLIGTDSAKELLLNKWQRDNRVSDGYWFSRSRKAAPQDSQPREALVVFDRYQPDPDRVFVGTLRVFNRVDGVQDDLRPQINLPFVVERRSGRAVIFGHEWQDFDTWLPTKTGLY